MSARALVLASKGRKIRHIPATWWGKLSYRQLSLTYEVQKAVCPWCGHELVEARYVGSAVIQLDSRKSDFKRCFWMPLMENGVRVWVVSDRGESG
jgi:hypothetical protein